MVTTPLRQRMQQAMRIRNLSERTTRTYLSLVSRFALFFHRAPDRLDLPDIERYLFFLRDEKKVSYCLFNQTVCALRFLYLHVMNRPDLVVRIPYGRREKHYPIVLSLDEVFAVLAEFRSLRDRVLITVLYSAGLRLGEVWLRVENIDSARMLLHIRQAKGHKDRYAPLSPIALELLREWWRQTMRRTRPTGLLFPCANDPLRPLDHSTVQRALRIAVRCAGLTNWVVIAITVIAATYIDNARSTSSGTPVATVTVPGAAPRPARTGLRRGARRFSTFPTSMSSSPFPSL